MVWDGLDVTRQFKVRCPKSDLDSKGRPQLIVDGGLVTTPKIWLGYHHYIS
jgi:hypothetical protein